MLIVVLSSPEHAVSIIKKSAIKNDFIIGVLALRILTVVGKIRLKLPIKPELYRRSAVVNLESLPALRVLDFIV